MAITCLLTCFLRGNVSTRGQTLFGTVVGAMSGVGVGASPHVASGRMARLGRRGSPPVLVGPKDFLEHQARICFSWPYSVTAEPASSPHLQGQRTGTAGGHLT